MSAFLSPLRGALAAATLAVALAPAAPVLAQAPYEQALASQIARVEALTDDAGLADVVPVFERIAAANTGAWLPQYYAAHYNLLRHWTAGEDGCKPCVERADAYLTRAEATERDNAELMVMRARYYQAMTGLHPMRAPYYGPKATNMLEAAIELDPRNPRAAGVLGTNLYYTPSMFGGGAAAAHPHLARAAELYTAERANAGRAAHLPRWGAPQNADLLARATAAQ